MYVFLVEECEMIFRWHVWRYDKQNREMISEGFDKTKLTFQWQPLLMMTVWILLRWQSWDRSIHTQFEFGRRLKHPSWYTFQSLQAVHRSFFYSIIDSLGWLYLLGSSTRYTQSIHGDDSPCFGTCLEFKLCKNEDTVLMHNESWNTVQEWCTV